MTNLAVDLPGGISGDQHASPCTDGRGSGPGKGISSDRELLASAAHMGVSDQPEVLLISLEIAIH